VARSGRQWRGALGPGANRKLAGPLSRVSSPTR
jgi:hypothetical protein